VVAYNLHTENKNHSTAQKQQYSSSETTIVGQDFGAQHFEIY